MSEKIIGILGKVALLVSLIVLPVSFYILHYAYTLRAKYGIPLDIIDFLLLGCIGAWLLAGVGCVFIYLRNEEAEE